MRRLNYEGGNVGTVTKWEPSGARQVAAATKQTGAKRMPRRLDFYVVSGELLMEALGKLSNILKNVGMSGWVICEGCRNEKRWGTGVEMVTQGWTRIL